MASFDLRKSVSENANKYFSKAKKLKGKIEGMEKTVFRYQKEKEKILKEKVVSEEKYEAHAALQHRKKEWFEQFHWFYTSFGNLCVGGRDAGSNELLMKKYTEKNDIVFHTDMAGSPFFLLKRTKVADNEFDTNKELQEVADVTASYSRAWKKGMTSSDVFYVEASQVTKEANAGESLSKGSFVVRGKTNYVENKVRAAISVDDSERVMCSAVESVSTKGVNYVILMPGDKKTSDVAKELRSFFKKGLLDEYVRTIPAGGCKVFRKVKGS